MEYIKINETKLKIMLDSDELSEWDISVDELDYANPAARSIFEGLLEQAKDDLGFDTVGYKVLLQLYPSCDGGCELFITRLGETADTRTEKIPTENKIICHEAYSFKKLSHLLSACKRLSERGFAGESSAYFSEDGKWYLTLCFKKRLHPNTLDELSFISEYGESENPKATSLYLCEYANTIREGDAVSALAAI